MKDQTQLIQFPTPKVLLCLIMGLLSFDVSYSQIKIGQNPTKITNASLLELESDNKGLLLPRLADTLLINNLKPENGMLIYLLKAPNAGLYIRNNGKWKFLTEVASSNYDFKNITGKLTPLSQLGPNPSTQIGQILKWDGAAWITVDEAASTAVADASLNTKGIIQLNGDLNGFGSTATTPIISDNSINTAKIQNLSVTDDKISSINGSKIIGDINSKAINVTGVIAISNGGTGATKLADVKTNFEIDKMDNTSDLNKPISISTLLVLDQKETKLPTGSPSEYFKGDKTLGILNKTDVGMSNVDNTSDILKVISNDTQSALDLKANIASLDLKAPLASPTFTGTVNGISKSMVELGNVDNTSDLLKVISNDTQAALDLKANIASPALTGIPVAPTAASGTNTDQIATTAFVLANRNNYNSIDAIAEISTSSSSDLVIPNFKFTPGSGTYLAMFNGQYENSSIGQTQQVSTALTNVYNEIASKVNTNIHQPVFGNEEILLAGVYSVQGAGSISVNLTLDANGDENALFIIKVDGALTMGAGSNVILAGSAKASNIFWITTPGNAISLAATTIMKGTLIANGGAVNMGADGNLEGRLLSTNGAIAFGPGIGYIPSGNSSINLGSVANFIMFTSVGAISNTGTSTITGNIGTNDGAITGFESSTVNGTFSTPLVSGDALATFSVYQNGTLIANSSRKRVSTNDTEDTSLQAIATVADGQDIDIRWNTTAGTLKLKNRIFTLIKLN